VIYRARTRRNQRTDYQTTRGDLEKTEQGVGKGKATSQCRRDCEAETDQARGIVEERFSLEDMY